MNYNTKIKNIGELFNCFKFQNKETDIASQFHYIFGLGSFNFNFNNNEDELMNGITKGEIFNSFKRTKIK